MQIVIIGTGNAATVLGKRLHAAGHVITQVYGRNPASAQVLAEILSAQTCLHLSQMDTAADLYLMAIADQALQSDLPALPAVSGIIAHTAGAVSMQVLSHLSDQFGVLYPLQSLRKEIDPVAALPMLVDGNHSNTLETLMQVAGSISSDVVQAGDADRLHYHLCGVVTNNFSNYLYTLAEDYCTDHHLQFRLLLPLIEETAARLHQFSPARVQTGPAARKDMATIRRHLELLEQQPALRALYEHMTEGILALDR